MVVQAPKSVALDRRGQHAIRELRKLRAERDELNLKIKKHEATLAAQAGDDGGELTVGGRRVATYTVTITRTLSKTLVEKHRHGQEVIADCTVLGQRRKLTLIEDE